MTIPDLPQVIKNAKLGHKLHYMLSEPELFEELCAKIGGVPVWWDKEGEYDVIVMNSLANFCKCIGSGAEGYTLRHLRKYGFRLITKRDTGGNCT